jgi:magnesium transporter
VIKFHIADKGTLYSGPPDLTHPVPPEVLWIDICSPTRAEEAELERALGLDVPTESTRNRGAAQAAAASGMG